MVGSLIIDLAIFNFSFYSGICGGFSCFMYSFYGVCGGLTEAGTFKGSIILKKMVVLTSEVEHRRRRLQISAASLVLLLL